MGVECNPRIMEPAACSSPHPIPDCSCSPHGALTEDPEEQSSQLSMVLAAEIPAHFFWARLRLPAPREAAVGAVLLQAALATQV